MFRSSNLFAGLGLAAALALTACSTENSPTTTAEEDNAPIHQSGEVEKGKDPLVPKRLHCQWISRNLAQRMGMRDPPAARSFTPGRNFTVF